MMNYVQTTGLHKLFTDNTFTEFTSEAIAAGVNSDSIIYIICLDDTSFGEKFEDGAAFIWARGKFYGDYNTYSIITEEQVINLVKNIVKV